MKLVLFPIVFILTFSHACCQQLLGESFNSIKDEAKKYNEEIAALYYKETPVSLIISRNRKTADYAKYYMFFDQKCVSETYFYPTTQYDNKLKYLKSIYGEPTFQSSVYNWTSNNLRITITTAYSGISKSEVCQINYAFVRDLSNIIDIAQKTQSPFIKMVTIKTNPN